MPIGTYHLRIETADGDVHMRTVEIFGDQEVRLDLDDSAVVEGVVTDAETQLPIQDANLVLEGETALGSLASGGSAASNTDGSYRLIAGAGRWRLRIGAEGYVRQTMPVDLSPGEHRSGLQLALVPANLLTPLPVGAWSLEIQTSEGQIWQATAEVMPDQVVQVIAR